MVLFLCGDRFDLAVGGRRQELRRKSERPPFRVEAGNEKSLRQLSNSHYVGDFGAVRALVPLRVVVPHRVRLAIEYRRHGIEIEPVALAEEHKIGLEPARARQRPPLRELAADKAVGALVVYQQRLVTIPLESTLGAISTQILEEVQPRVHALYPSFLLYYGLLEGYWCIYALLPRGTWDPPGKPVQHALFS